MTPRIGSLCSGYGGLDLGLMSVVGGSVAWHVENDKHPSAVLDARFPGVPNYGDLTTVDWTQVEPVDWFTAGYPCQPFSHAGKRRGSKDDRHLWPYIAGAIGVLRPRRVFLENVAGHVSLGLDAVLWDLAALGYDAVWGVVRAADAGACHGRARLFIIAADSRSSGARWDRRGVSRAFTQSGRSEGDVRTAVDAGAASLANTADRSSEPQWSRTELGQRDASLADAPSEGRERPKGGCGQDGWTEPLRSIGAATDTDSRRCGDSAQQHGDETSAATDRDTCGEHTDGPAGPFTWGDYEPAVRRWERVTGRRAPRPTEPGRSGERLNPRFVEWMQGLPDGWVTDLLSRNPALKCLGNGVVPQQAALALRLLLPLVESEAA